MHKKQLTLGQKFGILINRQAKLILLTFLALIITLSVPVLSVSQTTNPNLLLKQGIEHYQSEQFQQAIALWKQAAEAFTLQHDNLTLALVLSNLSSAYQDLGQWQEAEEAINQSLKLLQESKHSANSQIYTEILAKALNNQGSLQWAKGQLNQALETWKLATANYAQAGNQTGILGSTINQTKALQSLGFSSQAYKTLAQLEELLKKESDAQLQATGLLNLGNALRRIGKLKESEEILQESTQLAQRPTTKSSALLELGNTQRALARRSLIRNKKAEAEAYTQKAIASYQEAAQGGQLQAKLNLLSFWLETGKWSEALEILPAIQQSITSLSPSRTAIYAQLNLAQSLTCFKLELDKKGNLCYGNPPGNLPREKIPSSPEIAQILSTALQQAKILQDPKAESQVLGQLGSLYEFSNQWQEAQKLTQQAILRIQLIQAPEIIYRWQWQLGRLWRKQGKNQEAIAAYSAAVNSLKSVRGDLLTINSDLQFDFRDQIEPVYRELVDLLLRNPNPENLEKAIANIDALQLAELENFLGCDPSLIASSQQNINLEQIDTKAAFIYPIILEDRLEVIFKLPGQTLKHQTNPIKQTEVETTLKTLREALVRGYSSTIIENSQKVYGWLIEPLEKYLEESNKVTTLVFVLDSDLRNIPMSTLYDAKTDQYLIEKKYALVLLPSSQIFDLRSLPEQLQVLGAGINEKLEVENRQFAALNITEELEQIEKTVASKILLNSEFTQTNIEQYLDSGSFSGVHLATHGKFSSDPEDTYILVYKADGTGGELLKASDFGNLLRTSNQEESYPLQLLILSACQTAEGDNRATLGLAGLAVRAGAQSTLATLWQVGDDSTVKLMEEFYEQLKTPGVSKAEALHLAQQSLLANLKYQNPSSWAPYVLVGNWL